MHPNVDKKSFIRAKQNQIHQQRFDRKHQIETLKYERIVNDGLLLRIDRLLLALQANKAKAQEQPEKTNDLIFRALMETASSSGNDSPPEPPAGVHANADDTPSYSKMMAALVDQVRKTVDESSTADRYSGYIAETRAHKAKVDNLQIDLVKKLAELEGQDKGKITSESIHYGFDKSGVSKGSAVQAELLNPKRPGHDDNDADGQTSGADADNEDGPADESDDENTQASDIARKFGQINMGDYRASLNFISANPHVLREKETDGLLIEAFSNQSQGHSDYAKQCVHQALLLQYCRQLGKDGVQLFFKRVTTPNHQAQKLFIDDVNSTYDRIRTRTAELAEERAKMEADGTGGVEQIQLHAVEPGTTIHIVVPPVNGTTEEEKQARQIFDGFSPGLQKALESNNLDKINLVLAKMSVDEAEQVVEALGNGGMLSLEEGVIDATTDEGRQKVQAIEQSAKSSMPQVDEEDLGID